MDLANSHSRALALSRPRRCTWSVPAFLAILLTLSASLGSAETVTWIKDTDGNWNDATAWSTGRVPSVNDDVLIDRPSVDIIVSASGLAINVRSLIARERLIVNGGSLRLHASSHTYSPLVLSGGALLWVSGSSTSVDVLTSQTLWNTRFRVEGGAVVRVSGALTYDATGLLPQGETAAVITVSGTGSTLDLSSVQNLYVGFPGNDYSRGTQLFTASAGGTVDLSGTTLLEHRGSFWTPVTLTEQTGGQILLPALEQTIVPADHKITFQTRSSPLPSLTTAQRTEFGVAPGATLQTPLLQSLNWGWISVPNTGVLEAPLLTNVFGTHIALTGTGQLRSGMLTQINNASFALSGGATFNRITATTYDVSGYRPTGSAINFVTVTGAGSYLDLSTVQNLQAGFPGNDYSQGAHLFTASAGGIVNLSGTTTLEHRGSFWTPVTLTEQTGGQILLPALEQIITPVDRKVTFQTRSSSLPSLTTAERTDLLIATGATVRAPLLHRFSSGSIPIPTNSALDAPLLTNVSGTSITLTGTGQLRSGLLTEIANTRFTLSGGAVFERIGATVYDVTGLNPQAFSGHIVPVVSVAGAGSRLNFSSVHTLRAGFAYSPGTHLFEASQTGIIDFSGTTLIENRGRNDCTTRFRETSNGQILFTSLQSVTGTAPTVFELASQSDQTGPFISNVTVNGNPLTDGALFTGVNTIACRATDRSGVSRVQLIALAGSTEIPLASATGAGPTYSVSWNPAAIGDGAYTLLLRAFDSVGNRSELSFSITVDVPPPPPPVITRPAHGSHTADTSVTVAGTAAHDTKVQLFKNGALLGGLIQVDGQGNFSAVTELPDGETTFQAEAHGPGGVSAKSSPVKVTLDRAIPLAPLNAAAQAREGGEIRVSWSAADTASVRYRVYRSSQPFASVTEAQQVSGSPTAALTLIDLPSQDGSYYYRVVALNAADTPSDLSSQATAVSDRTPPRALNISYLSDGPVDTAHSLFGVGNIGVTVTTSEELIAAPFLSFAAEGGAPVTVKLTKKSSTEYQGTFSLLPDTVAGTMFAVFSAHDHVGNRGTVIDSGKTLLVDTQGPVLTALMLNPGSPLQNDATAPLPVTVSLVLSEAPRSGTTPTFGYTLSGKGVTPVTGLTSGADRRNWQASFVLPAAAGLPEPETLSFTFSAQDDVANTGTKITAPNSFQVYQGDLPPLAVPVNLRAVAQPRGRVLLTWSAVTGAVGYELYRKGPNAPGASPLVRLRAVLGATTLIDETDADGEYEYAVASIREVAAIQAISGQSPPVKVLADSVPPLAPEGLSLELKGQGIAAAWQPSPFEAAEVVYNLYRADLPPDAVFDITGKTPVRSKIVHTETIDAAPSPAEHAYAVTAVDSAGNESAPSATAYLNFGLLPVSTFHISRIAQAVPELVWSHENPAIVAYRLLKTNRGSTFTLYEGPFLRHTDTTDISGEQSYSIIAIDEHSQASVARTMTLPDLSVTLAPTTRIRRGLFSRLPLVVHNRGASTVEHLTVSTILLGSRSSGSELTLGAGQQQQVDLVVPGLATLLPEEPVEMILDILPHDGESVQLTQTAPVAVEEAAAAITLATDTLERGATGKVRFTLSNPSDAVLEILTARDDGNSPSNEVRFKLLDGNGNVFAVQPFKQSTGSAVVTTTVHDTVARIQPGAVFVSEWLTVPLASSLPENLRLVLEIDKFRHGTGTENFLQIPGQRAELAVQLTETLYAGEITGITPAVSHAGESITITGRVLRRDTSQPVSGRTMALVIAADGFQRTASVVSGTDGAFRYVYDPAPGESGRYTVSVVAPGSPDRPNHGEFTVRALSITPASFLVHAPRNFQTPFSFTVTAGKAAGAGKVRLAIEAEDQPAGTLPPGLTVTFSDPVDLLPAQTKSLTVTVSPTKDAALAGAFMLRLLSEETGNIPLKIIPVTYKLTEAVPSLSFVPANATMSATRGGSSSERVLIRNNGLAPLLDGTLTLLDQAGAAAAPAWISLATPVAIARLEVGQSLPVEIAVRPPGDLPSGYYNLQLRVTAPGEPSVNLPILVAATESGVGSVIFHVSDIYTATLNSQGVAIEGLEGARIKVQHEDVSAIAAEGLTNRHGELTLSDLPAGPYLVRVSAPKHMDALVRLTIKAGITVSEEIFLQNHLISVEWSVRETTIEDKYEVILTVDYETDVPAAVVVIEPPATQLPDLLKGEVYYGELSLTNYGLIRADNLRLPVPAADGFAHYEFLASIPETLNAKERIVIPYRITALKDFSRTLNGSGSGGGNICLYEKSACAAYSMKCANGADTDGASCTHWYWSEACPSAPVPSGGFAIGGPGSGGGGGVSFGPSSTPLDEEECGDWDSTQCSPHERTPRW